MVRGEWEEAISSLRSFVLKFDELCSKTTHLVAYRRAALKYTGCPRRKWALRLEAALILLLLPTMLLLSVKVLSLVRALFRRPCCISYGVSIPAFLRDHQEMKPLRILWWRVTSRLMCA